LECNHCRFDSAGPGDTGIFYSVNAQTGAIAAIGQGSGVALSSGPAANTILYSTGVNTYELNVANGQQKLYGCIGDPCSSVGDHAFDRDARTLYALGKLYPLGEHDPNPVTGFFKVVDSGTPYPGVPNSTQIEHSLVGVLGLSDITVIEYVPGVGLIGTDGFTALYRISTTDGQASLLTTLSIGAAGDRGYRAHERSSL
jgi:hypothetical protein